MASRGEFWSGRRVLAIDANHDSLKALVSALRHLDYNVTPVMDAKTALQTLWEAKEPFKLAIGEVEMPDTNGVDLLRYIKLQTGIPVIAVTANMDTETVMKGMEHGVCNYLLKPVRVEQLRNICQHALRRNPAAWNDEGDANQRVQSAGIVEGDPGPKSTSMKNSERIIDGDADSDENMGLKHSRRPRVTWTKELHDKFEDAYHQLGKADAVPKKICEMMNVDYISRLTVASHLQKYRAYLRRISDPKARASRRRNSSMSNLESSRHYVENRIPRPSSVVASSSSNNPFTTRPIEPRKNLGKKKAVKHGARSRKSKDHAKALCGFLLNTNQGKACSHLDYPFENMPDEETLQPVNQLPVQPPELVSQPSVMMNAPAFFQKQDAPATNLVGALSDASKYFPNLVGNCNPWQTALPSMFPGPSQVNIPEISQLTSFAGTSSSQMPMVTNEMSNPVAAFISSSTPGRL
ncbi:hypothetical protein BRADI_1g30801v3 [Brachypodium distachyon]|uniref:Response regulatory domain-containing protein n=1 Tax=Brachypodium distachyon TaxID=15368 RepID=A0A0Q3NHB5_BRADI|nr:hypothetical protein BRADI_1g30801v3 [Brachypodium distachyon]